MNDDSSKRREVTFRSPGVVYCVVYHGVVYRFPGVVYRVPCADCNHVYIGETEKFPRKMKEHERDVKNKKVASNAIAEHAHKHQHDIDWDNAAILCKERNVTSRLLLESSFIQTHPDMMNRNEGMSPLTYMRSLLQKLHL